MKKKFILLPLVGALLYVVLSSYSEGPAYTAGYDRTGATGTVGCGTGCHATSATPATNVTVTLLSGGTPVTTYTPGASYTVQISGLNTSSNILPRFGFQVSVVKNVGGVTSDAGAMTGAPTGTHVCTSCISGFSVSIWEHFNFGSPAAIPATSLVGGGGSGTTYVENISWTAPSAGTGCITIYGVLNAVNYSGDDFGDYWNNTSLVINESVAGITGTASVCVGATTTLTDATPCGVWSSGNTGVATVSSGVVTGVAAGTATISYTAGTGNTATKVVTVTGAPPNILGTFAICKGSNTTLSDAAVVGTWTSSNTTVASINLISGTETGVAAGTATITFVAASSGCRTTTPVTVNPLPSPISGTASVCAGLTTALTDAGGGTWTSSNTTVATIGTSSGVVTGGIAGTSTIVYTLPTGCTANTTITVNPLPSSITGTTNVCPGFTTALTDAGGGTWTSSNTTVATVVSGSGVVTGVAGGTSTITYMLSTGCTATTTVSVYPLPPSISGTTSVCAGLTTALTDATTGGTWTSDNTSVATVGTSSGIVTGVSGPGGTANISYTVPVTGCVISTPFTVNPLPPAITGTTILCPGTNSILSDAGTGSWTSSNTAVASIDFFTAFTSGITAGTSTITFTIGTGCIATTVLTVNPSPPAIGGVESVCSGSTTNLSDATTGGTWVSSNTAVATIGSSSGVVNAVGTFFSISNITYTAPTTGCTTEATVTVNPLPSAITGTGTVCSGSTTALTDAGSGTWSSSNTAVATVSGTGTVTGIGAGGTATISFTLGTGCSAVKTVTVNPLPLGITGIEHVCTGSTTALTDATGGGTWTSSTTTVATVGTGSGIVTGLGAGGTTAVIAYTLSTGCKATAVVTVNALPGAITGASAECAGATITLTSGGGGSWSSTNTTVATVGSGSGGVTGVSAGTTTISYTSTTTGCASTKSFTVNTSPSAITGSATVCAGHTTSLTDAGGGTWSSSTTSVATVGSVSGIVTAVAGGTSTITYALPTTGCSAVEAVTVNPLGPISGTTSLCLGLTTTLSDAASGGTWTSSNTVVATIGSSSGFVNTLSAGSSVINYTTPAGCIATTTLNIVSSPTGITGNTNACLGQTTALTDGGGGTWTSSNTSVASVGISSGIVTGVSLSTATITYSLGTGCTTTTLVTVNPLPASITGTASVCAGGATTALTDATGGGNWASGSGNATIGSSSGIVTGVTAGTATISYSLITGCSATKSPLILCRQP
jgi:uncharacterized protein YjdB